MCRKYSADGAIDYVKGEEASATNYPGLFKVTFGGVPSYIPNYQVVDVADDYSWAIVSSPIKWPIWILSRTETLPDETIDAIKFELKDMTTTLRLSKRQIKMHVLTDGLQWIQLDTKKTFLPLHH